MKKLDHLKNIIHNYDHLIIDLWGVVHNGIRPYQGALKTIEELYYNKQKLLDNGDRWESLLAANIKADNPYR